MVDFNRFSCELDVIEKNLTEATEKYNKELERIIDLYLKEFKVGQPVRITEHNKYRYAQYKDIKFFIASFSIGSDKKPSFILVKANVKGDKPKRGMYLYCIKLEDIEPFY